MSVIVRPRRWLSRSIAAASLCIFQSLAGAALAHVKVPDYSHIGHKTDPGKPETATRPEAREPAPARAKHGCDVSFGARLSSDMPSLLLSEVRRGSIPSGSAYRQVLSLLDDARETSDVVQVAEGVRADGGTCLLYVSMARGGGEETYWRFAPDDQPEGWFDDWGRRLGDAALGPPKPGSRISSPFGPRRYYGRLSGGGFHDGIDYEARIGEPIYAAADGVIEHQGGYFEYGLTVKIRHAEQFTTLYAHMARFAAGLAVGSKVHRGQLIGYVGMTGRSTGAHLHFSTIVNGKFVDPASYLSANGNHALASQALVAFRKWQSEIRAAVKSMRDRQRRSPVEEVDWTTRT